MRFILLTIALFLTLTAEDCGEPVSASGLAKANVTVTTGADGLSIEQRNIKDRLVEDNKVGSIKHLYVISAYSGQVLMYSTVRGKVTSGGKRLSPEAGSDSCTFRVPIGSTRACTNEVLGDDGAYGNSLNYLFWWDTKGIYHQHYVEGGQIVHISSQPLVVPKVVLNLETSSPQ